MRYRNGHCYVSCDECTIPRIVFIHHITGWHTLFIVIGFAECGAVNRGRLSGHRETCRLARIDNHTRLCRYLVTAILMMDLCSQIS